MKTSHFIATESSRPAVPWGKESGWGITKEYKEISARDGYGHYLDYGDDFTALYIMSTPMIRLCIFSVCILLQQLYFNEAVF